MGVTMWAALGTILPIAVAVAVSSTPILAMLLILLSPNRNRSSLMFLIGWVLGLVVMVSAFSLFVRNVGDSSPRHEPWYVSAVLIAIGLTTVVMGIVLWSRGAKTTSTGMPKWLSAVSSLGPWSALGLAFVLNLRPKGILLGAAAGLSLRGDDLSFGAAAIVIGVYTVISASTVAGPVIATLVAPERAEKWLIPTRNWLTANNRLISILIMIMVGVVIIGSGLVRL